MRLWELLLLDDAAATVKPKPTLTPARSRHDAERKAAVEKRDRDARPARAKKVRDLRPRK